MEESDKISVLSDNEIINPFLWSSIFLSRNKLRFLDQLQLETLPFYEITLGE